VAPAPPLRLWSEIKSRRGRPKHIDASGHACPNPDCDYRLITDANLHALVGNGHHGATERIARQSGQCMHCLPRRSACLAATARPAVVAPATIAAPSPHTAPSAARRAAEPAAAVYCPVGVRRQEARQAELRGRRTPGGGRRVTVHPPIAFFNIREGISRPERFPKE
jgi:hypothetical protein